MDCGDLSPLFRRRLCRPGDSEEKDLAERRVARSKAATSHRSPWTKSGMRLHLNPPRLHSIASVLRCGRRRKRLNGRNMKRADIGTGAVIVFVFDGDGARKAHNRQMIRCRYVVNLSTRYDDPKRHEWRCGESFLQLRESHRRRIEIRWHAPIERVRRLKASRRTTPKLGVERQRPVVDSEPSTRSRSARSNPVTAATAASPAPPRSRASGRLPWRGSQRLSRC
jgi:hypothetical protein